MRTSSRNRATHGLFLALLVLLAPSLSWSAPTLSALVGGTLGCNEEGVDSAGCFRVESLRSQIYGGEVTRLEAVANARASFGSLGVDALAVWDSIAAPHDRGSVESSAQSTFSDTLTISDPALTGTPGSISFRIVVDGGFAASYAPTAEQVVNNQGLVTYAFSSAQWYFLLQADGGDGGSTAVSDSTPYGPQSLTLLTSASIDGAPLRFTYGTPFVLDGTLDLELVAATDFGQYTFLSATFLHSADLNGIAGVRDANGNLVTDYTITAASGSDYTQPFGLPQTVPEPETYSMVLAGLGLLGFAARRRKQNIA